MEFDKNTILAFLLIGLILIFINTDFYQENFMPKPPPTPSAQESGSEQRPSEKAESPRETEPAVTPGEARAQEQATEVAEEAHPRVSAKREAGEEVIVETNLYRAVFSTQGATVRSWTLKEYFIKKDSSRVQLVGGDGMGNLALLIPTEEDTLDTSPYLFEVNKKKIDLTKSGDREELVFTLNLGDGRQIEKTFTFFHDRYSVDMAVELLEMDRLVEGFSYFLTWKTGLASTEPDIEEDMNNAQAYAFQGEAESFDVDDDFEASEWDNPTEWVAIRTKYFTVAAIPQSDKGQAVRFAGEKVDVGRSAPLKRYRFDLKMPFENEQERMDRFTLYIGPLDYDIVKNYHVGLEDMMNFGWAIFRPFGKFVLWSFKLMHNVIPNYGWIIVIFSLVIKVVLYPLTRKSYQSMKEMQALQPLMQEINEKYKDDPQKKQQEVMKLYKEHGVNPLGGCIPMLLQMPLLIALFNVFQSTIQLRGAPFILWMQDLSRPDTVAHLPFSIPLYGDSVNILPLFMGVTMFVQQKISMKDPKQKAMVYFMPIFFTLLFNSFPSGLNLYYALFNLFSIAQEKLIPYHPKSPEEMKSQTDKKKKPKRRRMKHDYIGRK